MASLLDLILVNSLMKSSGINVNCSTLDNWDPTTSALNRNLASPISFFVCSKINEWSTLPFDCLTKEFSSKLYWLKSPDQKLLISFFINESASSSKIESSSSSSGIFKLNPYLSPLGLNQKVASGILFSSNIRTDQ